MKAKACPFQEEEDNCGYDRWLGRLVLMIAFKIKSDFKK